MIKPINEIITDVFDTLNEMSQLDNQLLGFSTGFLELDNKTSGILPGSLTVVAGRPSIGKTSFVTNLAESFLFNEEKPVLFFSFESNAQNSAMRLISSYGKIHSGRLRSAKLDSDEWSKVTGTFLQLQEKNLVICDDPSLRLDEIGDIIINFCAQHTDACVIIDDIQRIKPYKSLEGKITRSDELTEISRYLKELAQKFNISIVVVSQLNRNLENRPNKRPVISDLRDCGAIEDNADLIMFIYRDEVYNKESKEAGTAEIFIGKHRNGPIGKVRLAFEGQYTRFSNLSPEFYAQDDDEE